jgi:hypothetical protein|tara:strand:- start:10296 stop:10493 length:198 start_codon:yes stop_codon:yes gene_type:complete
MRFVLILCVPAVALWGYGLNYSLFSYFSTPFFADYQHVVVGIMIFFTVITFMILSILVNVIGRLK